MNEGEYAIKKCRILEKAIDFLYQNILSLLGPSDMREYGTLLKEIDSLDDRDDFIFTLEE